MDTFFHEGSGPARPGWRPSSGVLPALSEPYCRTTVRPAGSRRDRPWPRHHGAGQDLAKPPAPRVSNGRRSTAAPLARAFRRIWEDALPGQAQGRPEGGHPACRKGHKAVVAARPDAEFARHRPRNARASCRARGSCRARLQVPGRHTPCQRRQSGTGQQCDRDLAGGRAHAKQHACPYSAGRQGPRTGPQAPQKAIAGRTIGCPWPSSRPSVDSRPSHPVGYWPSP